MDLHHSRISVTSEGEGCGTTFTLDIPVIPSNNSRSNTPNNITIIQNLSSVLKKHNSSKNNKIIQLQWNYC